MISLASFEANLDPKELLFFELFNILELFGGMRKIADQLSPSLISLLSA